MTYLFFHLPLLLLLGCASANQSASHKVDLRSDYNDLRLDQPYSVIHNKVELVRTSEDRCARTQTFNIQSKKYLHIGNLQFDQVELEFVQDSLARVMVSRPKDTAAFDKLKRKYRAEFGEPVVTVSGEFIYTEWNGRNGYIHIQEYKFAPLQIIYGSKASQVRAQAAARGCEENKHKKEPGIAKA